MTGTRLKEKQEIDCRENERNDQKLLFAEMARQKPIGMGATDAAQGSTSTHTHRFISKRRDFQYETHSVWIFWMYFSISILKLTYFAENFGNTKLKCVASVCGYGPCARLK